MIFHICRHATASYGLRPASAFEYLLPADSMGLFPENPPDPDAAGRPRHPAGKSSHGLYSCDIGDFSRV